VLASDRLICSLFVLIASRIFTVDGTAYPEAAEPCAPPPPDASPVYEIGYGRPPRRQTFRAGVSGNPMGRPRRAPSAAAAGRIVPAQPTVLEHALAEPTERLLKEGPPSVCLARALVARLTRRALEDGDVAACRELLRLVSEAEATACERARLAAERDEAEALAAEAERAAEAAAARTAKRRAQDRARGELAELAAISAGDRGEGALGYASARAFRLLDVVEADLESGELTAVKPWLIEAARDHDPSLPRHADLRPLDLTDVRDALSRLDAGCPENDFVPGWVIDAALARTPDRVLTPGERAQLALVREDPGAAPKDWAALLAAVDGSLLPGGEGGARRPSRGEDAGVEGLQRP